MPGIDTAWISTAEGSKVTNFALKASYSNIADLPLSATVVYADKNQNKVIGIGADYICITNADYSSVDTKYYGDDNNTS